jgi:iron complex outermembrane recepter protein
MKHTPTVFLIDDDTDDQEIFSLAMEQADKSVHCVFANDGIHALEKIKTEEGFVPDFIFIDMNMPRMNGLQCLKEIKKIARLQNTPVFMYSTSADPSILEENKKLGAVGFILKPSDINDLAKILIRIVKQKVLRLILVIISLGILPAKSFAQADTLPPVKELKKLSVEELMNIVVTSVSKTPEKLTEVASAVQVVTGEQIRRSGTLRLPGALRLATNMQVFSSGAHDFRISSRGFNGFPVSNSSLADKLLVLIDGRTVYTPLFGGVYWDVQNVLQEDIKQVEVVSGPGGALWGANAVNGIVNIVSKSAKETQGIYASGAGGGQLKDFGAVRYGSHIDTTIFYRVYAQRYDFNSTTLAGDIDAKDAWNISQGGFRMDYIPSAKSTFTLQGDLYGGKEDDSASTQVNGQNIIGRWTYSCSDKSGFTIQSYFDRTYRNIQSQGFIDELSTFDIDMQHNFFVGNRNKIVWGVGYRIAEDKINTILNDFIPADKTLQLFSGFVQDQIAIVPEHLELTLGTKVLHNDYTDFEFHPTIRLAWIANNQHTLWTAVSQAVRIPTRLETDHPSPLLGSFGNFKSEKVMAYELGYRVRPIENVLFSLATYYNRYTDLRSLDTNHTPPPLFYFGNNLKADTYGIEVSANAVITNWWKLRGGYTWLHEKFTTTSATTYPQSNLLEAIDPQNQFLIQSMMDVAKHFQIDGILRYVDVLPAALSLPSVPSYLTFDLRIAWSYKWFTVSAAGSNLAQKYHGSSGSIQIPRSVYGRITINL